MTKSSFKSPWWRYSRGDRSLFGCSVKPVLWLLSVVGLFLLIPYVYGVFGTAIWQVWLGRDNAEQMATTVNVQCWLGESPKLLFVGREVGSGSPVGHAFIARYARAREGRAGPCTVEAYGFYPRETLPTLQTNMVIGMGGQVRTDDIAAADVAGAVNLSEDQWRELQRIITRANNDQTRYGVANVPGSNCIGFVAHIAKTMGLIPPYENVESRVFPAPSMRAFLKRNANRIDVVSLPVPVVKRTPPKARPTS